MSLTDLIPTLQLAIGPVILISGVGLILLSMTNRFGRIIDRSRILTEDLRRAPRAARPKILAQLKILASRARTLRSAIALAAISVLLASILIITLFLGALLQLAMAAIIVGLFILCMLSLIVSLLLFISDMRLSLKAFWLEMPPEARRSMQTWDYGGLDLTRMDWSQVPQRCRCGIFDRDEAAGPLQNTQKK